MFLGDETLQADGRSGLTGGASGAVRAHHLLSLRDDSTAGAPRTRTGLAIGGGARGGISIVAVTALLTVGTGCIVSAVTNTCVDSGHETTSQ